MCCYIPSDNNPQTLHGMQSRAACMPTQFVYLAPLSCRRTLQDMIGTLLGHCNVSQTWDTSWVIEFFFLLDAVLNSCVTTIANSWSCLFALGSLKYRLVLLTTIFLYALPLHLSLLVNHFPSLSSSSVSSVSKGIARFSKLYNSHGDLLCSWNSLHSNSWDAILCLYGSASIHFLWIVPTVFIHLNDVICI